MGIAKGKFAYFAITFNECVMLSTEKNIYLCILHKKNNAHPRYKVFENTRQSKYIVWIIRYKNILM